MKTKESYEDEWHCHRCKQPTPAYLTHEWLAAHTVGTVGTLSDALPGLWSKADGETTLKLL